MATVTLAESAKLSQNMLVQGVIENVITVNKMYSVLPFQGIDGNSLAYNRENALGDVDVYGAGDTIAAKAAATFTQVTSSLTSIIGDAEVNGLIQATRSNINDQKAVQVASKAKSAGRKFQDMLINGTGSNDEFTGLAGLVAGGQTVAGGQSALSLELLDELLDKVIDKDGEVDFITMSSRELRAYYTLLRSLGGASIGETVTLPSGIQVPAYRGTAIFRNDYIATNAGAGTNEGTVFAGNFDDGSMSIGIAGLTAREAAGIVVEDVGTSETKDETITRVKWYCSLANYNEKGLAALTEVVPAA